MQKFDHLSHNKPNVILNVVLTFINQFIGLSARTSSVTKTGHISSRSHSILTVYVSKKVKGEGLNSWEAAAPAKLHLVDLAGSEIIGSKPDLPVQYLGEAKIINKSLSALGLVIAALTSRVTSTVHIPFRNSKLTRILEDSLGGTSKLSLIISVSPAMSDSTETLSSLRFGLRAKIMKNRVLNNMHSVSSSNYGNCNNSNKSNWTAIRRASSGSSKDSSQNESPDQTVYRINDKIIEISLRRERRLSAMSGRSPEDFKTPEKKRESIDAVKLFDSFSKEIGDVDITLEDDLELPSSPPISEAICATLLVSEGARLV
jgi:Kinesin motor domain